MATPSDTLQPEPSSTPKPRQRSSIACQPCNTRRVKCNAASHGLPCGNCERHGRDCKLIDSKRGRKRKALSTESFASSPPTAISRSDGLTVARVTTPQSPSRAPDRGRESREQIDGPEMLYAQMLEQDKVPSKRRNLMRPGGQIVYLGETFNLTYLLHQNSSDQQEQTQKFHYTLPADVERTATDRGSKLDAATLQLLQQQDAFVTPAQDVCQELFEIYFAYVQPHYPIIDAGDFRTQYKDPRNPPSWLLFQAVLFMAAGHCEESLLQRAGFKSRSEARPILFKRTKALYDADHEMNKVTIVQALFLMSFWWATPVDQKDTWHWLGSAISLATTIGMHRSTKHSDMAPRDQRLWARIWWSLFTEDKHAAAALGRPVHIRLSDCDVTPLEVDDYDNDPSETTGGSDHKTQKIHVSYAVHLSKLSKIVERIIEKSFHTLGSQNSARNNNSLELCEGMLQVWEAELPRELRLEETTGDLLWPSMLQIALCWFRILAHRTRTPTDSSTPSRDNSHQVAVNSAIKMVRIVEDLLAMGHIQHCPIHVIPALFAAMSMHTVNIRSGDKVVQQLAYVKVKTCMIALRELQSSWPVSGWIFLLFAKIVRGIRDEDDLKSTQDSSRRIAMQTNDPKVSNGVNTIAQNGYPVGTQPENAQESHHRLAPLLSNPSSTVYNSFQPAFQNSPAASNYQYLSMPLDFSTDWSGVRDEELWLVPGLDVLGDLPRANNFSG